MAQSPEIEGWPMVHQNPKATDLKVLITGGGGFLGSHLCRRLLGLGCEVHATSRFKRERDDRGPIWWEADMADLSTVRRVVTAVKPDIIYHLAGSVGASPELELVMPTYHSLLTSTLNVLMAGTEAGSDRCFVKFAACRPGHRAAETFERLLDACDTFATSAGLSRLVAGVNTGRLDAYRRMLARGFTAELVGVAMLLQPEAPHFDTPSDYVVDDLR